MVAVGLLSLSVVRFVVVGIVLVAIVVVVVVVVQWWWFCFFTILGVLAITSIGITVA